MAILQIVNPKTNGIEFKVRYWWKDADGNLRDSKTGWFLTVDEALEEADKLKLTKQQGAITEYESRKDQNHFLQALSGI